MHWIFSLTFVWPRFPSIILHSSLPLDSPDIRWNENRELKKNWVKTIFENADGGCVAAFIFLFKFFSVMMSLRPLTPTDAVFPSCSSFLLIFLALILQFFLLLLLFPIFFSLLLLFCFLDASSHLFSRVYPSALTKSLMPSLYSLVPPPNSLLLLHNRPRQS